MADSSRLTWTKSALLSSLVMLATGPAVASSGSGLPWDAPIQKLVQGVSGPVAFGFAFMGLIAVGVRWVFGGDLGPVAKNLMTLVIGVAILSGAAGFLAAMFGLSGAVAVK